MEVSLYDRRRVKRVPAEKHSKLRLDKNQYQRMKIKVKRILLISVFVVAAIFGYEGTDPKPDMIL